MHKEIELTVAILAFNVDNYLEKCIQSVVNQKADVKFEILIINDGSTDHSGVIADTYAKKYGCIRVIHSVNEGLGPARNKGIDNAKGKWILFLDGDDYLNVGALRSFEAYSILEIDACLGRRIDFYDGNENALIHVKEINGGEDLFNCNNGKECFSLIYKKNGAVDLGTKGIYRVQFLRENNLYFKPYKRAQDNEWAVRMFRVANKMSYNSFEYYCYRRNRPGSAVNSQSLEKALGVLEFQREWVRYSKEEHNDFGLCLELEAQRRFWEFFNNFAVLLKKEDVFTYCREIDKYKDEFDIKNISLLKWLFNEKPSILVALFLRFLRVVKLVDLRDKFKRRVV